MNAPQVEYPRPQASGAWRGLRLLFFLFGLILFFYVLRQAGLEELLANVRRLGRTFLLLVLLYGGVHFLRAVSWRLCLREEMRLLSLASALRLWLCGEAVSHLSFSWSGEAFRAAATRQTIAVSRGLSALVVSRLFYSYASLLLVSLSLLPALWLIPASGRLRPLPAGAATLFLVAALLPLVAARRLAVFLGWLQVRFKRHQSSLFRRLERFVGAFQQDVEALLAQDRRGFLRLVALNLLASLAGVLEVYLVLRALAVPVSPAIALFLEGMSKVLSLASFLVPGNVGVREGGMAFLFGLLQFDLTLAVTLVLVRRARALVWVALGSLLLMFNGLTNLPKS